MSEDAAPKTNSSTRHVLEAMMLIAQSPVPLGLNEIADAMNLPPSTAHRALMTLEDSGFAQRAGQGAKLMAGEIVHHLIRSMIGLFPARRLLVKPMRALSEDLNVTVSLNWRVGWHSLRLLSIEGSRESYQLRRVGEARPLHSGIGPTAILCGMTDAQVDAYVEAWPGGDAATVVAAPDRQMLRRLQTALRACGYVRRDPSDYSAMIWIARPLYIGGPDIGGKRAFGSIAVGFDPGTLTRDGEAARFSASIERIEVMQAVLDTAGAAAMSPFDGLSPEQVRFEQSRFLVVGALQV